MEIKNIQLRAKKGRNITFSQLAEEVGVHRNTLSNWFNQSEMNPVQRLIIEEAIDKIKKRREGQRELL